MTDEKKTLTDEQARAAAEPPLLTDNELDILLTKWHEAEAQAASWKAVELELRNQIFNSKFPHPKRGMNKTRIGHGMALIGDYRLNYTIDKAALEESKGFIPIDVFEAVISYKPEVKPGGFNALTDEQKKLFGSVITEKPGTPGLEIKPQTKVRW